MVFAQRPRAARAKCELQVQMGMFLSRLLSRLITAVGAGRQALGRYLGIILSLCAIAIACSWECAPSFERMF